jgi:hypothetical protein
VSEQSDGSWEASSFVSPNPENQSLAEPLFEAVEQDLGAPLSATGLLTDRAYQRLLAQSPGEAGDYTKLGRLWASEKSAALHRAVREETLRQANPQALAHASRIVESQTAYLTTSSTLAQFNAIAAAIHGAALSLGEQGLLRVSSATALLLHVAAASMLCWAARPVMQEREDAVEGHRLVAGTFRNHRRGWRMTVLALVGSVVTAAPFVLQAFGIAITNVWPP